MQSSNGLRDKLCGSALLQRRARRVVSKQCLVMQAKVAMSDESDRIFIHEFAPVQGPVEIMAQHNQAKEKNGV